MDGRIGVAGAPVPGVVEGARNHEDARVRTQSQGTLGRHVKKLEEVHLRRQAAKLNHVLVCRNGTHQLLKILW